MVISEKVRVITDFSKIFFVEWKNRSYKVDKVGFHHFLLEGKTLMHVFSVISGSIFLKIKLDTKHLAWTFEEIQDNGI